MAHTLVDGILLFINFQSVEKRKLLINANITMGLIIVLVVGLREDEYTKDTLGL